jgi:concanavalin A-like lectin/glucanase superfamily protein
MAIQQLMVAQKISSGATDPYFSSVIALLHLDGTNGSTTFTDNSPLALTYVRDGTPTISTTQSKFGGASLTVNGTNQNIRSPSSASLSVGSGDFTIECFARTSSIAGGYAGIVTLDDASDSGIFRVGNVFQWYNGGVLNSATISTNTWYHVAVSRAAGTERLFVNGVGATGGAGSNYTQQRYFIGASSQAVEYFGGFIDEVRITKGVGRYTSNFTPPAAPFPDS